MLEIRDKSAVPREGWRYPAVAGKDISVTAYAQLYPKVENHYRVNGKEPPTREEVILWLCENTTVPCNDGATIFRNWFTNPRSYVERGLKSPTWPLVLMPLKLLAQPGDKGLGSIVERVIGPFGGDAYKRWFQGVFGKPCGCGERRDNLDRDYPL